MFEYKIDNITVYNTAAFETESEHNAEKKIASWIIKHYEKDIIEDIIDKNYEGFGSRENAEIAEKVKEVLKNSETERSYYIENRLKDYFLEAYHINVLGFIRFRLKDYRNFLEIIIDEVVDQYVCEEEYYEFIELIKEYISVQEKRIPVLHVVSHKRGNRYFDIRQNDITDILKKECAFETDLSEDDKLLTTVVLSAPHKIVWHNWESLKNEDLKGTLREIFGETLVVCPGCKFCKNNN